MKGFVLGLLVAALAFGGYFFWQSREAQKAPSVSAGDGGAPAKRKRKRGRSAARVAKTDQADEPEPEPIKLSAADRKMTAQGDELGRTEVVRMDLGEAQDLPELTQDDIDRSFRAQEDQILACIDRARPEGEVYIPGLVNVKFRIHREGKIRGIRVEAPAILQRGGLTDCIRGVVEKLRFPASGSSQIVTYPFRLS